MDTLYTFWDNITHYKTKGVHFLGLMNSATRFSCLGSPKSLGKQAISGFVGAQVSEQARRADSPKKS